MLKNRIFSLLIVLFMITSLLVGCGDGKTPENGSSEVSAVSADASEAVSGDDSSSDAESSEGDSSDDTSGGEGDIPDGEADFFDLLGVERMDTDSVIPDNYTPTDVPYLYETHVDLSILSNFDVRVSDGVFHLTDIFEDSIEVYMYSCSDGSFIRKIGFEGWNIQDSLDGGGFWSFDAYNISLDFFDRTGTSKKITLPSFDAPEDEVINFACVSSDGKYLVVNYCNTDTLLLFDLDAATCTQITADTGIRYWDAKWKNNRFVFSNYDTEYLVLDPATQATESISFDSYVTNIYDGFCNIDMDSFLFLKPLTAAQDMGLCAKLDPYDMICDIKYGMIATHDSVTNTFYLYDLRNENRIASVKLDDSTYYINAKILKNGTVLLFDYSEYGETLYVYDLATAIKEAKQDPIETVPGGEDELKARIEQLVAKTESETGVDILYGSEGNDFVLYDYIGAAETNVGSMYVAVSTVADILNKYPKGMLKEAYEGTHKGLKIYLCGTIYGIAEGALGTAGGVTTEKNGYIIVAVDINNNLEYDIPHELSHVFDRKINDVFSNGGTDWMSLWNDVTKVDGYTFSYNTYTDNYRYTMDYESDPENVWFTDSYARTFPTEDRAQIMKTLFNPDSELYKKMFEYENLVHKARVYSYILRECFDSCDTSGAHYWERDLGVIDSSVLG